MSLFPEDAPYRVLARKYRPAGFDSLIGQEAVVQTLANAIASNRLAQAWLLTGVRGVGKTSTARIIAKALNCTGPDGNGGPTINPCGQCANCAAISAGQHIDVIEMDAASNTGVDNIREIIEAVRYASVSARYKVYIVDEVHMLSKGAFNALLKTLEEPPPHVKFIFATTEVQKVPATILSRCQRFDLKRVPADLLAGHFAKIAEAESVSAEPEALTLIARAAEGSVRDGLSILDQAIAMGNGEVAAQAVRDMLGLADRGRTARLLDAILSADAPAALAALNDGHDAGAEPQAQFAALLDMVHSLTRTKIAGSVDPTLSEEDTAAFARWADLGFAALHRIWQMLLKGHAEINQAPDPQQAAEMAVLRMVHAAGLPDPDKIARMLQGGSATLSPPAPQNAQSRGATPVASAPAEPAAAPMPADFAELVMLFESRLEAQLVKRLTDDVACISLSPGALQLQTVGQLPTSFAADVRRCLNEWTGQDWQINIHPRASAEAPTDALSLRQLAEQQAAIARAQALEAPMIKALMQHFPDASLGTVTLADPAPIPQPKRATS